MDKMDEHGGQDRQVGPSWTKLVPRCNKCLIRRYAPDGSWGFGNRKDLVFDSTQLHPFGGAGDSPRGRLRSGAPEGVQLCWTVCQILANPQTPGAARGRPPTVDDGASWLFSGPTWSNLAVLFAMFVHLVQPGSYLAPTWPIFAPTWPNLAPTWPNLVPSWPNLAPTWSNFGPNLVQHGPKI